MLKFLTRRFLHLIPVIIVISILIFLMMEFMPGDPVQRYLGQTKISAEKQEQIRKNLGYDKPAYVRYFIWLKNVVRGDFGESISQKKPVKDIIPYYIFNSFILNCSVFVIAFFISIPIGIRMAVKKYSVFDSFWTVFSLIGVSMPSFFFGLILIYAFSVNIPIFPISGMVDPGYSGIIRVINILWHMVLPGTVLMISSMASLVRYVRNSMLEVLSQDYVRTARAKGLSEKVVIYKHAFRNALIPIVTLIGLYIPALFSGAVILESTFNWPGIGTVLLRAVNEQDPNLYMALMMFFALLMLLGNILADIGYAIVDPRVRLE